MTWLRKFWQDCHGGLSPSIAIIMMYLITVCGMGANAAYLMTQKMRIEGVAEVIALEAMRGIRDTNRDLDGVRNYAMQRATDASGTNSIDINLLKSVTTIQFGTFDQDAMAFTEDETTPRAAVVTLDFTAENGHPARRLYYTTAGRFTDMSVRRVAQFYTPRCYTSGIASEGRLTFSSSLSMTGKYCLRSNDRISLGSTWSLGNDGIISVPPGAPIQSRLKNTHEDSGVLEYRNWKMQISKDFMGYFNAVKGGKVKFPYVTNYRNIKVHIPRIGKRKPWRHARPHDFHQGRINYVTCWNKDTLVFKAGTYSNMVIVTDCRVDISRYVSFNNMMLITTKGGKDAIEARQGLRMGNKSTACSSDIATVFMTRGGIDAANSVKLFGAQLITYAENFGNSKLPKSLIAGGVEMIGSSVFSGGELEFRRSVSYRDCQQRTSRGFVNSDYIRTGVY